MPDMTPTPPPTPDDKLMPCKICGGPAEPSNLPTCWPCVERAAAEFKRIGNTRAALAPTQQRSLGPCIQTDAPQPSPDDAAVLDAYVEACECDAPKCLDAKMKTRAAVLARMAHPDRAVLDAADIANRAVLAWISELMDAKPDTPEMVMLKRLSDICHAYESVRYPIGEPK